MRTLLSIPEFRLEPALVLVSLKDTLCLLLLVGIDWASPPPWRMTNRVPGSSSYLFTAQLLLSLSLLEVK